MDRSDRYLKLMFARDLRRELWAQSRKCGVPFKLLVDVERHSTPEYYATLVMLLETKNFKSAFRESVARQARNWFENEACRERWSLPLSRKQIAGCSAPGMSSRLRKMPRAKATAAHVVRQEFGGYGAP